MGSFTNIAERKAAEAALKRNEEWLRAGVTVAKLALTEIDYATDLHHLSAEAAVMFGLGNVATTLKRGAVRAVCHPDDRAELEVRLAAARDPRGSGWFAMDHRVVWPDGQIRWLRVRAQVPFEQEGAEQKPRSAVLAALDITASKDAEAAVRQSERRFRDLAESLPQFIWITDRHGDKTYCNQRYLDYMGLANDESMEWKWLSCIHPEDRSPVLEAWKQAIALSKPYAKEYRLKRHDGEYRHFLAQGIPIYNESGGVDRWLGNTTDIHERKLLEEALGTLRSEDRLAAEDRVAANLSQEISSQLVSLMNLLYLMKSHATGDEELVDLLKSAQEEITRMAKVTEQRSLLGRL